MLHYLWITAFVAVLYLYFKNERTKFSRYGVKYVRSIPLVGIFTNVLRRKQHPVEATDKKYYEFKDEKFYGQFELTNTSVLTVKDIELIKKITVKDFEHFLDHRTIIDQESNPLFGRNLLSLKGQEWKEMRSTLSPAFTSSKIRLMVPFMVEVGHQMMNSLKAKIKQSQAAYIDVDVKDMTSRFANDVIASCAFGVSVDSHHDEHNTFYKYVRQASTFGLKRFFKILGFISFPTLMKLIKAQLFSEEEKAFFRTIVLSNMSEREEKNIFRPDMIHLLMEAKKAQLFSEEEKAFFRTIVLSNMSEREEKNIFRPDMIHLLMEAKKGKLSHDNAAEKDADAGFATVEESAVGKKHIHREWNDDDLVAQAILFFIAGFEVVSNAMSFLLYELAVNPEVQDRLYQEIKDNEQRNDRQFDYNSVQSMKYLDMVVSETLRLWPVAPSLERICNKDYNCGRPNDNVKQDYIMRRGDILNVPVYSIHRDATYFPNPTKFDPERFSDENKHNIKPFTYMPFGLGPRNCIGSRFALCEIKVMVYQLLKEMEVSPCEKTCIPAKLSKSPMSLGLEGGHWVRMTLRA